MSTPPSVAGGGAALGLLIEATLPNVPCRAKSQIPLGWGASAAFAGPGAVTVTVVRTGVAVGWSPLDVTWYVVTVPRAPPTTNAATASIQRRPLSGSRTRARGSKATVSEPGNGPDSG